MPRVPPAPKRSRRGRGEGSINLRNDGTWHGRLSLGVNGYGKRKRLDVYGETKAIVAVKLDELRAQLRTGTLPDAGQVTVNQLLDRWLAALAPPATATRTHEKYSDLCRLHLKPRIGGQRLGKLHALHIEALYAELRRDAIGPTAIRDAAIALSQSLTYAVRLRLIPANPSKAVKIPKVPVREMLCLTEAQARRLLAACNRSTACVLIAVALGTGCRQGELLALEWRDLDLKAGTLVVRKSLAWTKAGPVVKEPKTKASRRTISLTPSSVRILLAHRSRAKEADMLAAPVFATSSGRYAARRNVLRALRSTIRRANKLPGDEPVPAKLRFHDLRHSMASLLLSRRHSIKAVASRLGHANPAFTLRVYAHTMPDDDTQLTEGLSEILG